MGMPKTKYLVTPTWSVEENAPHMISIESNSTLMRAAASSAEFNSRLLALRQSTYYDFHTNLDMVPRLQQPSSINVEIVGKDKRIIQSGNPGLDCTYPLTLLPGQKKDTISL